jgi:hypothetical protein
MIQIKKLKKPNKRSGHPVLPNGVSNWKEMGVHIRNVGKHVLYVDSVTPKKRKRKKVRK